MISLSHAQKQTLRIVGIYYIILGTIALISSFTRGIPDQVFWICYSGMFLLGFGLIKLNRTLILAQCNLLAVTLVLWSIDFIYQAITHKALWGLTNYFFIDPSPLSRFVSIQHLFMLPLMLSVLYVLKLPRKSAAWKLSLTQATLLFTATILLTNPALNVNCAFYSCINFLNISAYYPWAWFVFLIITLFFTENILRLFPGFGPLVLNRKRS